MHTSRVLAALGTAALATAITAPAALAAPDYPPTSPTTAAGVCVGDVPFLAFQVDFGSDEVVGDPMTVTFVNPAGDDFVIDTVVPAVGESASVLWPGASQDPADWPGWELNEDGVWVETTQDAGAFTRAPGGVAVEFETNPTLTTSVTYPPASAICANPAQNVSPTVVSDEAPVTGGDVTPTQTAAGAATTPQTGADAGLALTLGLLSLALGVGLVLAVRRWA